MFDLIWKKTFLIFLKIDWWRHHHREKEFCLFIEEKYFVIHFFWWKLRFSKNRSMMSSDSSRMFHSCLSLEKWMSFVLGQRKLIFQFLSDFELRFWFLWKNKIFHKIIKIISKLLLWWCLTWLMSCWSSSMIINLINWWWTLVFLVENQGVEFQSQFSGVEHDFSILFTFFDNQFFDYLPNKTEIFENIKKWKVILNEFYKSWGIQF